MDRAIKATFTNHRNEDDCGPANKKYFALIATAERS
jgi:hypothetical protein